MNCARRRWRRTCPLSSAWPAGRTSSKPSSSSTTASAGIHPAPGTRDDFFLSEMTIGPGFTYQFDRYLETRFTYGVPIQRVGLTGDTLRAQFAVTLTY